MKLRDLQAERVRLDRSGRDRDGRLWERGAKVWRVQHVASGFTYDLRAATATEAREGALEAALQIAAEGAAGSMRDSEIVAETAAPAVDAYRFWVLDARGLAFASNNRAQAQNYARKHGAEFQDMGEPELPQARDPYRRDD